MSEEGVERTARSFSSSARRAATCAWCAAAAAKADAGRGRGRGGVWRRVLLCCCRAGR